MVGEHLQSREDTRHHNAPQIPAAVAEHDTRYRRRDEAQRKHLPDVARGNDDEIVAGERPHDGTQRGHPLAEVEGAQQDVEPQQKHEHIACHFGEPQLVDLLYPTERIGTAVRGRHLIGGHAGEQRIGPARTLAVVRLAILHHLHVRAHGGIMVGARQHLAVHDGFPEIGQADDGKQGYHQHVG